MATYDIIVGVLYHRLVGVTSGREFEGFKEIIETSTKRPQDIEEGVKPKKGSPYLPLYIAEGAGL
jgi:hypothetical protein